VPKMANSTGSRRPQIGPTGSRALTDALYRCAKQDPNRRFHALYDKVGRPDMLAWAWSEVRENGGAPGVTASASKTSRPPEWTPSYKTSPRYSRSGPTGPPPCGGG
jgi:hypothetical protein